MLKDVKYSELEKNSRGYNVLLSRDVFNESFSSIAKRLGVSIQRARQIYSHIKYFQLSCYCQHLAAVYGPEDTKAFNTECELAYRCYKANNYVAAYLELKYPDVLKDYRNGRPGMSESFLAALPPFRREFDEQLVSQIIDMRNNRKTGYRLIGEQYQITPEKARDLYHLYYTRKAYELLKRIRASTAPNASPFPRRGHLSYKGLYDVLAREYPDLVDDGTE